MAESGQITSFSGPYRFLSNFYPAAVTFDGYQYPTVEHAYQAAKTLSEVERTAIRMKASPGQAKAFGRTVTLRPDWESIKLEIMGALLLEKFGDRELAAQLTATGSRELIEGNYWHDLYWGAEKQRDSWVGMNHLGRLLMKVRARLLGGLM